MTRPRDPYLDCPCLPSAPQHRHDHGGYLTPATIELGPRVTLELRREQQRPLQTIARRRRAAVAFAVRWAILRSTTEEPAW